MAPGSVEDLVAADAKLCGPGSAAAAPPRQAAWGSAVSRRLPDGTLHLQHGPIDLLIHAWADSTAEVEAAYRQAQAAFDPVLATLVGELASLRRPLGEVGPTLDGPVARRMVAACQPHRAVFITPMAAVAGAVADHVLAALVRGRSLRRACVNNGGDIALHLADGGSLAIGIADVDDGALHGTIAIRHGDPVRGIATSGWRGRSYSLGIADAVTVLAASGAAADAAATLIANAVNVDRVSIVRRPARELRDDTDLGDLPVTVDVGPLSPADIDEALDNGLRVADDMRARGLIHAACLRLRLRHCVRVSGPIADASHDVPSLPIHLRPTP